MKIAKIPQISFKGYDAAPIKNLYIPVLKDCERIIAKDIENIAQREGVGL